MTDTKIREVLDLYVTRLTELDAQYIELNGEPNDRIEHLLRMVPQMRALLDGHPLIPADSENALTFSQRVQAQREKLMRWIGFIQGVMWDLNIYTIDEMQEHNRDV